MASTSLSRNTWGTATNDKIFTMSVWVKRSGLGYQQIVNSYDGSTGNDNQLKFQSTDAVELTVSTSGAEYFLKTNRLFRDTSAWYHIVFAFDSTQATSSDRYKLYVNGTQETSFSSVSYPPQNTTYQFFRNSNANNIGSQFGASGGFFNGSMTHFHFIDGTAYDATAFGQYDANGVWTIKTSPSVTYGTNGFFILKNGNSVTDQSGNGNNFTVASGTLTNTEDCPSNVFNTMTALAKSSVVTLKDGGCTTVGNSLGSAGKCRSNWNIPQSGKWYCEYKMIADNQGNTYPNSGIRYNAETFSNPDNSPPDIFVYGTYGSELIHVNNGTNITAGAPASSGDIFGWCIDMDNGAIYIHQNGTYINSGNPTSGASKTGAIYTYTPSDYSNMCFVSWEFGNSETQWNFGNGYFSTTAVASAGTNASGNGIFEYDVPTGFTALSTKGLNL